MTAQQDVGPPPQPAVPATPPGLDMDGIRRYFAAHVPAADADAITARLVAGGRSNLTYELGDGRHTWVLRRPPLGHVLPTAHDMVREYRVLSALHETDVPVPAAVALCDDPSVTGAPFYVMERVDGVVLRRAEDGARLDPPTARRCSAAVVDVLARIHGVVPADVGLADFGRPEGFLERQVLRWSQQWSRSVTRDLPQVDDLLRRLRASIPQSRDVAIVHGDYRLDNLMLDPHDAGRVVAVLDWEMSTLGDPLADLGLLVAYWSEVGDHERGVLRVGVAGGVTAHDGFFTRAEVVEEYGRRTGRDAGELDFYVVFAYFKLAAILEGIHARHLQGKTVGEGFDDIGEQVEDVVDYALTLARRSSIRTLSA